MPYNDSREARAAMDVIAGLDGASRLRARGVPASGYSRDALRELVGQAIADEVVTLTAPAELRAVEGGSRPRR